MKVLGLTGWSGAGKTTLLTLLIPELIARGLTVSTIKHAHHTFDMDRRGKDSFRHREAGATEVLIASAARWALMHENRGAAEPGLEALLANLTPVDLVLVEGFKGESHQKIEVHREGLGKPLLCRDDRSFIALAANYRPADLDLPLLDLDDVPALADFVMEFCRTGSASS
ncbi:MAG: molybdopterin-guanine dinucleotide biosynthesis protein B [Alphaproteobacteria bacterium]|nr:molybdopterin-guanine dinucleotide biosynthesis protein B [Alphaproteobacteria bacterium]